MDHRYIKAKTRVFNLQIGRFLFGKNKKHADVQYYKCITKDCGSRCSMNISTDTIRDTHQLFDNLAHFKSLISNIHPNFRVVVEPFCIATI